MDFIQESLTALISTAKAKRLTIKKACALAKVHPSTVSRWKGGANPHMHEFAKLWEVVNSYKSPSEEKSHEHRRRRKAPAEKPQQVRRPH